MHTRAPQISCESCLSSLLTLENELPSDFYAAFVTRMKSIGYLRFDSVPMYYAFSKVERLLQKHFQSCNAYVRDSFDLVISAVAEDGIGGFPKICCSENKNKKPLSQFFNVLKLGITSKLKDSKTMSYRS